MTASERSAALLGDVARSISAGPLRIVVPAIGYLILYRAIVERSGLEVLGLWSLLTAVNAYLAFADIGFSQVLAREVGPDLHATAREECVRDHAATRQAYRFVAPVAVVLSAVAAGSTSMHWAPAGTSALGLAFAVPTFVAAAFVVLTARLHAAVLSAHSDNAYTQVVMAIAPMATFVVAIPSAYLRHPIEGFAVGALLAGTAQATVFARRLDHIHAWRPSTVELRPREVIHRVVAIGRRGRFLYTASLGFLLREPVFRMIVAAVAGLGGVAVYDIAYRLTTMFREVVASGFTALYPAFAYLSRAQSHSVLAALLRTSVMVLLALGTATLGGLVLFRAPVTELWLGDPPGGVGVALVLLATWQLLTIANLPFWMLLQSTSHDASAALAVWAHTAAVLVLIPVAPLLDIGVRGLLLWWLAAAVATQVLIFRSVHTQLGLLRPLWDDARLRLVVLTITCAMAGFASAEVPRQLGDAALLSGIAYVALLGVLGVLVWKPVRSAAQFARDKPANAVQALDELAVVPPASPALTGP